MMETISAKKQGTQVILSVVFLFFTGALMGWCYEVLLHLFRSETFVNRGMLHGPWLPIYGIGCVLIVALKKWIGKKPVVFFTVSVAGCAVLEYVTSWLMETIYHTRWWDYSDLPFNLNGRIFLGGLIGFGIAGILFAYLLLPYLEKGLKKIPLCTQKLFFLLLITVFLLDAASSFLFPNVGMGITHCI